MSFSKGIDNLTHTFQLDQTFCDALFSSPHVEQISELLLSHLWANSAIPMCHKILSTATAKHFGEAQREKAVLWTWILMESLNRDMKIVPYLSIRGLLLEAGGALRRAYEHVGVLTHIWRDESKIESLDDPSGDQYCTSFRREPNSQKAKGLKEAGVSKRFASMQTGYGATILYDKLSTFDVHGGTGHRLLGQNFDLSEFTCSFCSRPMPNSDFVGQKLEILTEGHKLLCVEIISLCIDHGEKSEDLVAAVNALSMFKLKGTSRSTELLTAIRDLLSKLRSESTNSTP